MSHFESFTVRLHPVSKNAYEFRQLCFTWITCGNKHLCDMLQSLLTFLKGLTVCKDTFWDFCFGQTVQLVNCKKGEHLFFTFN